MVMTFEELPYVRLTKKSRRCHRSKHESFIFHSLFAQTDLAQLLSCIFTKIPEDWTESYPTIMGC